jgi:hypothetical protein
MEPLRQQVINIQRQFNDALDEPNASAAQVLKREIQGLEDDLQVSKNPRTIEDRVKRIIRVIEGEAEHERIMDYGQLNSFRNWFEHFREQLHKFQ